MSNDFEEGNGSFHFDDRAIDAFLAISNLYLETSERLMAINATAARGAVAGSANAINALVGKTPATDWKFTQFDSAVPLIDGAFSYVQSLQDLTTRTRSEFTSMLPALFQAADRELPKANSWPEMITIFAKSAPRGKSGSVKRNTAKR